MFPKEAIREANKFFRILHYGYHEPRDLRDSLHSCASQVNLSEIHTEIILRPSLYTLKILSSAALHGSFTSKGPPHFDKNKMGNILIRGTTLWYF